MWPTKCAGQRLGLGAGPVTVDFPALMNRVNSIVEEIYEAETPEVLQSEGIDTFFGQARFIDSHTIDTGTSVARGKKFLLATGARPAIPRIDGLDRAPYLTYESLWNLDKLPNRMLVIGGGAIGCELAQAFARLGSRVTLFEATETILGQEEPEASALVATTLESEGVELQLATTIDSVHESGTGVCLSSKGRQWNGDCLLVATGRSPNVEGMGLEQAGVEWASGGVRVDRHLRTTQRHIYAAGDCAGSAQFTHYAGWQGFMATRNALLPGNSTGLLDQVPRVTFTDPELAQAGLTERDARQRYGDNIRTVLWPTGTADRAIIDDERRGFIKAVTLKNNRLAGATVVGPRAGEIIHEWALAIDQRMKLGELANTLHAYPTYSMATLQMATEERLSQLLSGTSGRIVRALSRLSG